MKRILSRYNLQGYALMRIIVGFLFLCHGAQKLFGFPIAMPVHAPAFIIYGAGPIELIGGALVMIGLFTQWAAFIASGEMAVAYWMAHGPKALLPIQNNGELAVLYCFIFLFISTQGSGEWSLDAVRNRHTVAKSGHTK
ncbi:MAG: DoxX family protein [Desulfuromonadaceae bacterium]|nr:DoxX family protein [Desulfuromonadaceae bacterium]